MGVKIERAGVDMTGHYRGNELDETEIVLRAWDGEVGQSLIPVVDDAGTQEWYAGQQCKVSDGAFALLDGFVGQVSTDPGAAGRLPPGRVHHLSVGDRNALLTGFVARGWKRPAETDRARMLAFAADWLPAGTTTTWVLNESLVNLPARNYITDELFMELMADIGSKVNKTAFLAGSDFHYHLPTSGRVTHFRIDDIANLGDQAIPADAPATEESAARHGVYKNTPTATVDAVDFDGTEYVEIADSSAYDATTKLTIRASATWTVATGIHTLIRRGVGGNEWWLRVDTGPLVEFGLQTSGGLTQLQYSTVAYNDGLRHQIAGTYDGTTMRLYVDGVEKANTPKTGDINLVADGRIGIGASLGGPAEFWIGTIHEFTVNTDDFTAGSILSDYDLLVTSGIYYDTQLARGSLRGYWRLRDRFRLRPSRPKRVKDPNDLAVLVRVINSANRTAIASDATRIARHEVAGLKHRRLVDVGDVKGSRLRAAATRILNQSKNERITYSCELGPFTGAQLDHLRVGDRIRVDSGRVWGVTADSFLTIAEMRLTPMGPVHWKVGLELENLRRVRRGRRPRKRHGRDPV
jgi:hypothetical protein